MSTFMITMTIVTVFFVALIVIGQKIKNKCDK
mgnify:CR=1 FL=1